MTDPGAVWHALAIPALIVDEDDRVVLVNGPGEGFLNRSQRTLEGSEIVRLMEVEGGLEAATARVRRRGAPLTLHDSIVKLGPGPALRCDLHLSMLDEGVLILIAPRDISGRVDRGRSSTSAARSAIGMAEMLAHEIKNPLAGITGAAQLLSMNLEGGDLELTDLIVGETRRIVKLLDQVEQFGNLRPPQRKPVNLHDVLDRARRSAMVGFAAHMTISEDFDPSLPPTLADPDQLQQVFLNLLKNAAQVGKQGGNITIRTFYEFSLRVRRPDGSGGAVPLQVEIVDDGPGVPPEMIGNLFEPFVSGRENGTGLGLALVAKIVHEHGGWITVDSVPGRTAFRLSLPMAPARDQTEPHGPTD
ncbi:two-component system sensor histidine kinase NtrB [Jannaschia seohaensis]|uniref:histidine kinase n=1 Tax=Jannaschia seohaensis TaxID=475081 RepID=A0A2Y9B5N4_9RHOB|nr:ATP-binding protein [Jannaschia seohaensis]PWJ15874.1 two-component system nitrogen regulation sensor histidine kinase GlnL [Jannaschia seohaensis]SSA49579.1 two-component system, NtrC family, nitrogen regulation sensor histidine kinase GlnL [Jannaschia seohaensis]